MIRLVTTLEKAVKKELPDYDKADFDLRVYEKDGNTEFQNYEEFEQHWTSLGLQKIDWVHGSVYFRKAHTTLLSMTFITNRENRLGISIDSAVGIDQIDGLFEVIKEVLEADYYIYDPETEKIQKINGRINYCVQVLKNLNSYQTRMHKQIVNEAELQEFVFPILKSHFSTLEDEFHLPRFAAIEYKPDFGIPELGLLIETKYIRTLSDLKKIQKEIHDDVAGYLASTEHYKSIVVLIYNNQNIPVSEKYIKDLERLSGIRSVLVIPGITPDKPKK